MNKLPPLTVIEASAGTGKTFALVTRLLKLIFNGVSPEKMVALTFSRKAAGEIFNNFIERLSEAAKDEATAEDESKRIDNGKQLSKADFIKKLREVIACQHLSLIGTLDSFLMRAVRMMPLELGLEREVTILSEYRSPDERFRTMGEMLMRESEDAKTAFRAAFRLALGRMGARDFLDKFSDFIEGWHSRYCDSLMEGKVMAWGDESVIWREKTPPRHLKVTLTEIRGMAERLLSYVGERGADKFIKSVREFSGEQITLPACMRKEPIALELMEKIAGWKIAQALKMTQGLFLLMTAYESVYAAKTRAKGRLVFEDMPRLLCGLEDSVRLALEYRMDAKFEHWLLDEFQDTSRSQWRAIKNLIDESSQGAEGRSVFIVGDRKQAIYDWRGGDVTILGEQVERAKEADNELAELNKSYRYVSVISEAVNRVFNEDIIYDSLGMDTAAEGAKWKFREHESNDKKTVGFVEVIQAEKDEGQRSANINNFFKPIENALKAVRPWERGITTAILVRKNDSGEKILGFLKANGITNVVFEGDSKIADSPVLECMAELVRLAEHADDQFAYSHLKLSPIAEAMYPEGLPSAAELSSQLLADFSRLGMVRKFREVREALKKIPNTWNEFTESRFEDFIKCASEFELTRTSSMRLSDFIKFLSHKMRRDFAEPGMIRIMTIHQSKGLDFDWVIIPFFEPDGLASDRHKEPLENMEPRWILCNPANDICERDDVLKASKLNQYQQRVYSALCVDYVAMTRAKIAMTIILHPANQKPPATPQKFSDIIRKSGLMTSGNKEWYKSMENKTDEDNKRKRPEIRRLPRSGIERLRPSEAYFSGINGDALFDMNFGKAAQRGKDIHAEYQKIEWASEQELMRMPAAFRVAFERKSPTDSVWREKSYELMVEGKWESGQFDRVVFSENAGVKTAVIYDFKTNSRRVNESIEQFGERIRATYSGQMTSYRRALSIMTGMEVANIRAVLLLEATGMTVEG